MGELESSRLPVSTDAALLYYPASRQDFPCARGDRMQSIRRHTVTLLLGGVRSGKSCYAQQLGERAARVVFVATAKAGDDAEMQRKIERHQSSRPAHWQTIEEPLRLAETIA